VCVSVAVILTSFLLGIPSHIDMPSLRNLKKDTRKLCRRTNRSVLKHSLRPEEANFLFKCTQHACCGVYSAFSQESLLTKRNRT
jgi:hypothetical protein